MVEFRNNNFIFTQTLRTYFFLKSIRLFFKVNHINSN